MAKQITLDDIRAAAEKEFGSTEIPIGDETITLVNVVRLPKEKRKRIEALQDFDVEDNDDQDEAAVIEEILTLVAKTPAQGKKLVKALGGDLGLLMATFRLYAGETELGEASPSQD